MKARPRWSRDGRGIAVRRYGRDGGLEGRSLEVAPLAGQAAELGAGGERLTVEPQREAEAQPVIGRVVAPGCSLQRTTGLPAKS